MKFLWGVIAAFAAIFVFVQIVLWLFYLMLGQEHVFRMASYQGSVAWITIVMIVNLLSGVVGGWIALKVSENRLTLLVLTGLILLVNGPAIVASVATPAMDQVRVGAVSWREAAQHDLMPIWAALLVPFMAMIGLGVGAYLTTTDLG